MGNKLNPFEEQLKKAASNFEVPYDASAWSQLEAKMDAAGTSGTSFSSSAKWFVAALVVVSLGTGLYFYNQPSSTEITEPVVAEKTTEPKVAKTEPIEVVKENTVQEKEQVEVVGTKELEPSTKETSSDMEINSKSEKSNTPTHKPEENEVAENKKPIVPGGKTATTEETKKANHPVKQTQKLVIESSVSTVCAGVEVSFILSEPTKGTVVWQVDNGGSVLGNELTHTFFEEGKHVVRATNIDEGELSNELEITVNPKPEASFTMTESMEDGAIPVVHFNANASGEKYYRWSLGDGFSGNGESISHTYVKAKDYEVSLYVMNKYGCSWTRYERFTNEKEFNLLAPNSFSPNGDGTNDEWFPKALESGYYKFELNVYDRNNRLIYSTQDPHGNWNGRVNGTVAISGDFYFWNAVATDPDGIQQQYKGIILVVN